MSSVLLGMISETDKLSMNCLIVMDKITNKIIWEEYFGGDKITKDHIQQLKINVERRTTNEYKIYANNKARRIKWDYSFNRLDEKQKWFIETIFPNISNEYKMKRIEQIIATAKQRIIKVGFKESCSRCRGTGHYSRNWMGQTYCYKCGGKKFSLPRLTKAKKQAIEQYFNKLNGVK